MNFVGHIHVARLHLNNTGGPAPEGGGGPTVDDDDGAAAYRHTRYLIGAALPDFAAMGRFRLTERPSDGSIRAGVELHHRTDDAFHSHRWFRSNSQFVSARLEREGLPRGAAKACGHVGVELLLDGQLLDEHRGLREAVNEATTGVDAPALGLAPLVEDARREDWTAHLGSVSTWPLPEDYRRPEAVAERLRRILSRRPRLAFTANHLEVVTTALRERQAEMERESPALIADLRDTLANSV